MLMSFFFGERVILIEIENVIDHIYFTRTMYHGSSIVYLSDNKIYCKIWTYEILQNAFCIWNIIYIELSYLRNKGEF